MIGDAKTLVIPFANTSAVTLDQVWVGLRTCFLRTPVPGLSFCRVLIVTRFEAGLEVVSKTVA